MALGGALVYRGALGHCDVYQALGVNTARGRRGRNVSVPYELGVRVDKTIMIAKSPEEVYQFWRNLENLPRFMQHLHSVTTLDDRRSHWIVRGPSSKIVEWDAEIINEQPNELIGWRSIPGSDVDSAGSVHFKPAPGGRGTEVLLELQYVPPGGAIGAALAKLMGEDPANQIKEDLRRFKQLMETGEISTIEGQPHGKEGVLRQRPARARRSFRVEGVKVEDAKVEDASEASFPASDAPSWTAPREELIS